MSNISFCSGVFAEISTRLRRANKGYTTSKTIKISRIKYTPRSGVKNLLNSILRREKRECKAVRRGCLRGGLGLSPRIRFLEVPDEMKSLIRGLLSTLHIDITCAAQCARADGHRGGPDGALFRPSELAAGQFSGFFLVFDVRRREFRWRGVSDADFKKIRMS